MTGTMQRTCAWAYEGLWGVLSNYFLVPHEPPALPVRGDERMDSFRPALGFLRYLKMWFLIIYVLIVLALLALWIVIVVEKAWVGALLTPVFLFVMIAPGIVVYLALHLRYDTTWYVMTDKSLRIRRG
ncbi:MAG: hypothetical protein O7G85_03920, partial [Planctomycetota bacterium]|nr:hypothetical protein [Planctomycetota bacterium]